MNIDILSTVPQFPGGPWVNHFIYGTLMGLAIAFSLYYLGSTKHTAMLVANIVVFGVSAYKKIFDYRTRGPAQGEDALSCIGKTFVTWIGIFAISFI